jgi:hypothetical protein
VSTYGTLAEALVAACGTEYEVVQLAPLHRWVLVTAAEVATYGVAYGWEEVR